MRVLYVVGLDLLPFLVLMRVLALDDKKKVLLLQVTIADSHPLSQGGVEVLSDFVDAGYVPIIIYIIPSNAFDTYETQTLKDEKKASTQQKKRFSDTPQYCMYIQPRAPTAQSRKRNSSKTESKNTKRSKRGG